MAVLSWTISEISNARQVMHLTRPLSAHKRSAVESRPNACSDRDSEVRCGPAVGSLFTPKRTLAFNLQRPFYAMKPTNKR
ncbi:hypothetical protein JOE11_003935 [Robbsia andropogonis]